MTFKYSEHMTRALRDYQHHSFRFWISNAIGLAIVLAELILYFSTSNRNMLWIALLVLVFLGFAYLLTGYVQPKKAASDKRYDKPFTLSVGETELRLSSEDLDNTTSWKNIRATWETDRYYFLFLDQTQFWIAPKAAFASSEDERRFREIAGRHHAVRKGLIR